MKQLFINKKIFAIISIFIFIFAFISLPKKAHAVGGIGDVVFDPTNTVQNTISAGNSVITSASSYSMQLKEFVLDGLLNMLVKQVIRSITQSVVNWINSGFQGSPSFVQNPGAFFLDVADQVSGAFLAQAGGPLTALCSPFSIDIVLALKFKYHPNVMKRYTCTLGAIIKNTKSAVQNATINGFTAGDFRQGGWPAFVSLTTEPQNNVYGAYLQAESELSWRVANAQQQNRDELSQGKGFLSWKKCKEVDDGEGDTGPTAKTKVCEVQTPGSVISSSLENQLGSGLRQLELADEINEVVNALFAQLVTQVLTGGLSSVSGSGPEDKSSYINNINGDVNTPEQTEGLRNQLLKNVEGPLKLTVTFADYKKKSFDLFDATQSDYKDAQKCFQDANIKPGIPRWDLAGIAQILSDINKVLTTVVTPNRDRLKAASDEAANRLQTLQDIKTTANTAKTYNEINVAAQKLSQMATSATLTNAKDVVDAQTEYDDTRTLVAPYANDAKTKLYQCRSI